MTGVRSYKPKGEIVDYYAEVHHKDNNRENNELDNLQVLCKPCHNIKTQEDRA